MDDCCSTYLLATVFFFVIIAVCVIKENAQKKADDAENKSGSADYVFKRNEDPNVIGGTSLDRFFVECVLSNCNDFTQEKNIAKAKLLAEKYNLNYSSGIENLYKEAFSAHEKVSGKILENKLAVKCQEEKEEYAQSIKYAEYYGKDKTIAMLTDKMQELRSRANSQNQYANMLMRSGQQQERDWATWCGIANGIAGAGAGISTALDIQAQNAQIRAQNEANMRAAMPAYMAVTGNASSNRKNADAIQKQIELLKEKLIAETPAAEVMEQLKVTNPTIEVSDTGAYKVTATVQAEKPLCIFGDVPAIADGTLLGHVLDENDKEIGTVKMVLPVNGVSDKVGILGIGLSGAERGKNYSITFSEYKLWLLEE